MKTLARLLTLTALALTVFAFTGCRTAMRPVITPGNLTITPAEMTPAQRMTAVIDSTPEWESAAVPVTLSLEAPARMSLSGRAYMVRDKSIFISLRKLGFEVAQLYVTNDSIFAVDKFNRRYLAESLESVLKKCPVNIHDIQNLLTGRPFTPGETATASKFIFDEATEQASWLAFPTRQPEPAQIGYVFSLEDNSLSAMAVNSPAGTFTAQYADYSPTPGGSLAGNDRLTFSSEKLNVSARWKWDWSQAAWNSPGELRSFSLPARGYTRIAAASLLKSIKPQPQQ